MRKLIFLLSLILCLSFLAVPLSAVENDKIVVVLDAGHGGYDGGTVTGLRYEKTYNLAIAQYLKSELEADGRFKVIMTREDDTYLKFLPRTRYALDSNADLFLSLHCNSNDYTGVRGSEAYITVVDEFSAYTLADKILTKIASAVSIPYNKIESCDDTGDSLGIYYWNSEKQWDMPGDSSLGKKSDYYSVNTWCSKFGVPSIIVEHGYLSNSEDAKIIDDDENLKKIAKAEAEALAEYYFGHTHSFSAERLVDHPANCTLDGAMSYRCKVCGAKTGTVSIPRDPNAHYWRISSSKAATCTEDGFIERVCQISYNLNDKGYDCEVHSYTEELPATGHDYATLEDSAAGHGFDGLLYKKCTKCGDEIKEVRKGEEHDYEKISESSPDCTNEGITKYRCKICGDEYEEKTPALGHDFVEKERVEAADSADGYVLSVCSRCGEEKRDVLSSCEHDFDTATNDSTCEKAGESVKTCKKCGAVVKETISPLGHEYETQMEVKPSCESDGYKREKCVRCGKINTVSYPATGHSYEERDGVLVCRFCGSVAALPEEDESVFARLGKNPIVLAALAIVAVQFVAVAGLVLHYKKSPKRKR